MLKKSLCGCSHCSGSRDILNIQCLFRCLYEDVCCSSWKCRLLANCLEDILIEWIYKHLPQGGQMLLLKTIKANVRQQASSCTFAEDLMPFASDWSQQGAQITQQPPNQLSLVASHMIQCWYGSCSTFTAFLLLSR